MAKVTKRIKAYRENIDSIKNYAINEALDVVKKCATAKFDESIEVSVILGIEKKSDQAVRGATVLPNGTGKNVKVAVFAQEANAQAAKNAGADIVGFEDLAEQIKNGVIDFDVLIAAPDAMRLIGPLGSILGPRGLMPNPKTGTVSANVAAAVKNVKSGQISYRTDKNGIIHCAIGKASFTTEKLQENLQALMIELKKLRPINAKGIYFKKLTVSSTMGPGIKVDLSSLNFE